ncbi:MAG TPA: cardiolipin synthase [Mobilitalea sp.]|nr:cardiolipin synthase [Mobilitalea sp.]
MNRIKLFINKTFIVSLSVVLQITLFIIMILYFRDYLPVFYMISYIISIAAVLWIVNNRMNPGFKIAWLIFILTLPIVGILIYFLYGGKKSGRKMHDKLNAIFTEMQSNFLDNQEKVLLELKAADMAAYRQSYYIQQQSLCPVYRNSPCTYYSPGECAYNVILEELKKAEEYIFLEYFIIDAGIFWNSVLEILLEKVKKGVDVRLIYDDMGSLFTLPPHYNRKLESLGIKCRVFNPFIPIISAKLNNRDHRKILLIDGKIAFTGGINLADEYINVKERFGYWKDSVILVQGEAVWSFIVMFLSTWNYLSCSKEDAVHFRRKSSFIKDAHSFGFVQPYADTPLDYEGVSETVYINFINKASDYVYITTPYLIIDNEMITALCNAAKSGVDVRIITPSIPDKKLVHMMTRSFYQLLLDGEVKIYEYQPGFIHSKTFVADDCYGIVGTVNLDYRSLYLHFECGVWMYQNECIKDIKKDFLDTLKVSTLVAPDEIRIKHWHVRLASSIMRIFAPLF